MQTLPKEALDLLNSPNIQDFGNSYVDSEVESDSDSGDDYENIKYLQHQYQDK